MKITIGHLYKDLMNIYGDEGNITTLKNRLEWRGYQVEVLNIGLKDKIKPGEIDIFFFGGGQDQAQTLVSEDLLKTKAKAIKQEVERGVPLLAICGGYQLLGEYYAPHKGPKIPGIKIFPAYTVAGKSRMIGNVVIKLAEELFNLSKKDSVYLVGFENHSGKTFLHKNAQALGKIVKGFGNNGEDRTEGCVYKNAIGCYMHGSLLPKNPHLADWIIQKALEIKTGKKVTLSNLNDKLELEAHQAAVSKFG